MNRNIANNRGFTLIDSVLSVFIITVCILIFACTYRDWVPNKNVPAIEQLAYRSVESTGGYGAAQYYVFDTDGKRFQITRKQFDSYKTLERR